MSILATLLALFIAAGAAAVQPTDLSDAEAIIARMNSASHHQQQHLHEYTVTRRYTLHNRHLDPDAGMTVTMKFVEGSGKQFTIVRSEHLGSISQRVIRNVIEEEQSASKERSPSSEINTRHYTFSFDGIEERNGQRCYRIAMKPKEKSKYLLDGYVWIDTTDFAIVRLEGYPSKGLSFWVGRPFIQQDYKKVGEFWVPSNSHSKAQVKLAGETELDIDCFNYRFVSAAGSSGRLLRSPSGSIGIVEQSAEKLEGTQGPPAF